MQNNLKLGDVVTLNSGGPRMTVYGIRENLADVCWFCDAELKYGTIPFASLKVWKSTSEVNFEAKTRQLKMDL